MNEKKIIFFLKDIEDEITNYLYPLINKFIDNGYKTLILFLDLKKNENSLLIKTIENSTSLQNSSDISINKNEFSLYIKNIFDKFKPNIMHLTFDWLTEAVILGKKYQIPTILYLDSLKVLCPIPSEMERCNKICLLCEHYRENYLLQEDRKYFFQYTDYCYTHLKKISDVSLEFIGKKVDYIENNENTFSKLETIFQDFTSEKIKSDKINVIWEGSQFINHSFAIVNREVELELLKIAEINLSIYPYEKHHFGEKDDINLSLLAENFYKKIDEPDFIIRNKWPPNFGSPLNNEKLIIVQPWEMGSMPKEWIENFSKFADQVWVASNANRDAYIKDGLAPERVKLIPWGVKKELFEKEYEVLELDTNASFKFLFNGGCVHRKGIDLLLKAYSKEFTIDDDVCLIIKDVSSNYVYDNNIYKSSILELMNRKDNPQIIYIAEDLEQEDLMSLYKSSDCYVHPYRGEGFGLPIVEAMASSLPVIVPNSGSAIDFCKPEFAYLVDFKTITLDKKILYGLETVRYPSFPEVTIESLRYYMRYAYTNREESKLKGEKAKEFILNNFTWKDTAEKIYKLLSETKNEPVFRKNKGYYFNDYQKKGMNHYKNNNYELAYSYLFQAYLINPSNVEVLYYKGICEYYLEDYKSSIQNISIAYKQGMSDIEGYKIIVACFEKLGDEKTAKILKEKYNI